MNYKTLQIRKKHCLNCSVFNLMKTQTRVKINRNAAFFIDYSNTKSQTIVVTHTSNSPPPPQFCFYHSLKLLSPTLPKLMNWILLSPPQLSSDPDTPQKNLDRASVVWCSFLNTEKINQPFIMHLSNLSICK